MSDNLRPMLYGARYEARSPTASARDPLPPRRQALRVRRRAHQARRPARPKPGDVVVTPATGGYGHSMANNYNGQPRPPVVFCKDGEARVVVRRETYDDLLSRDVD
jgi:diaminopimelate decarboxylase